MANRDDTCAKRSAAGNPSGKLSCAKCKPSRVKLAEEGVRAIEKKWIDGQHERRGTRGNRP